MSTRLQAAVSKQPSNNFSRFEGSLIDKERWLLEFSNIILHGLHGEARAHVLAEIEDVEQQVADLKGDLQRLRTVIATSDHPVRQHLTTLLEDILSEAISVDRVTDNFEVLAQASELVPVGQLWTRELESLHHLLTKAQGPLFRDPM